MKIPISLDEIETLRYWINTDAQERVLKLGSKRFLGQQLSIQDGEDCRPAPVSIYPRMIHTHPLKCYEKNGTFQGWPSGEDFQMSVNNAIDLSIIVAYEGIYAITLHNKNIREIWSNIDPTNQKRITQSWDVLGLEPGPEARRNFLLYINNWKLDNTKWFQVKFFTWQKIKTNMYLDV